MIKKSLNNLDAKQLRYFILYIFYEIESIDVKERNSYLVVRLVSDLFPWLLEVCRATPREVPNSLLHPGTEHLNEALKR